METNQACSAKMHWPSPPQDDWKTVTGTSKTVKTGHLGPRHPIVSLNFHWKLATLVLKGLYHEAASPSLTTLTGVWRAESPPVATIVLWQSRAPPRVQDQAWEKKMTITKIKVPWGEGGEDTKGYAGMKPNAITVRLPSRTTPVWGQGPPLKIAEHSQAFELLA